MKLILLNGPAGVGKSTISARLHTEMPNSILIDVDELRRSIPNYKEQRKESLLLAYQQTAEAIDTYLKKGKHVIIDKAISYSDTLDSFIEIAKKYGAEVYEIFLYADKKTVQKRADERGYIPGSLLTRERVGELWDMADALRNERPNAIVIDRTEFPPEETVKKILSFISP